jgi:exoribonuclease R
MQLIINFSKFKLFDPNNKYKIFHKDIIDENFNIIKTNRSKIILSGILDINSKMSYGYDKNKNPYKLFIPFNRNFPNFIVSYKNKKKDYDPNIIIAIKFISWLNEYPLGENIETYGDVRHTDLINIYERSLVNYNGYIQIKRNKKKYNINKLNEIFYTDVHTQNFKLICNIDPPGCTDIDDVISYSETDKYKIIGIHISDVAYVLKLFDQDFNEKDRYCTIYPAHGKPYNIINDDIIDNFLSLNPDKMRYVWSLYIYINDSEIENIELKPEKIINKISYTYDQVDNILKTDNTSYLYYISEFCLKLSQTKYQSIEYDINNSHHLISILMIFYNHYVGEYLNKNPNTIYRINDKITSYQFNSNSNSNLHTNLNLNNYLHITSPIRRYIDQYNQNLLYDIYNKIDLDEINESLNDMKIINNKYKLCKLIDNIYDAKLINISYDENKLYLKWLISEEKISDIIIDPLLEINNNEYKLINRINNKEIILKLNEIYKLEIKFVISKVPTISLIYF